MNDDAFVKGGLALRVESLERTLDKIARREIDRSLDFGQFDSDVACFGPLYSARRRVEFRRAFGRAALWFHGGA